MAYTKLEYFGIPHSYNIPTPWASMGIVIYDTTSDVYRVGIKFVTGEEFVYLNDYFSADNSQDIKDVLQNYHSVSWAVNPRSKDYDSRFANYQRI